MERSHTRRRTQAGNAMIEFTIAYAFLIPLALGLTAFGLGMIRYLQVASINRTAGSMFVRGADFTKPGYQQVLGRISGDLGFANSSFNILTNGKGVITLTELMRIGTTQCASINSPYVCNNLNKVVVIKQIVLGNTALSRQSVFGNPTAGRQTDGSFDSNIYMSNTSFVVPAFGTAPNDTSVTPGVTLDLRAGEAAFAAESFFISPEWNLFPAIYNQSGYYHRVYF
jgi:Flp pilus assembly protein TadG